MKKIIVILLLSVFFGTASMAQSSRTGISEFYFNWQPGFPTGNDFLSNFSARGFNFGYNHYIKDDLAVGIEFAWNNFYQYQPKKTYQFSDGAATTDLYKYIYTAPITVNVTHYFKGGEHITPYVRLGLGAQYSEQNLYYNVYETTNENWGFVAIPEVGAQIRFNKYNPWSLNIGARYSFSTNSHSDFGINNLKTLNFLLGFSFDMR